MLLEELVPIALERIILGAGPKDPKISAPVNFCKH